MVFDWGVFYNPQFFRVVRWIEYEMVWLRFQKVSDIYRLLSNERGLMLLNGL